MGQGSDFLQKSNTSSAGGKTQKHKTQIGLTEENGKTRNTNGADTGGKCFSPPAATSSGDADYCLDAIHCIPPLQMSQMIDNLHSWMGVGGRIIGYLPI